MDHAEDWRLNMSTAKKIRIALICGMLGCLCYGGGDWLMIYGNPAYQGTESWLTEGAAGFRCGLRAQYPDQPGDRTAGGGGS